MSGSLVAKRYTTNAGDVYAINTDESNFVGVHGVDHDVTEANASQTPYTLPRNIRPRYGTYVSTTSNHVRKVVIATPAIYAEMSNNVFTNGAQTFTENVSGTVRTFKLDRLTPEKIRLVKGQDTGLNDGTDE